MHPRFYCGGVQTPMQTILSYFVPLRWRAVVLLRCQLAQSYCNFVDTLHNELVVRVICNVVDQYAEDDVTVVAREG